MLGDAGHSEDESDRSKAKEKPRSNEHQDRRTGLQEAGGAQPWLAVGSRPGGGGG